MKHFIFEAVSLNPFLKPLKMLPILAAIGGAALLIHAFTQNNEEIKLSKRRLFISHSWRLSSQEYRKFISKLKYEADFYNHSIPIDKAFPTWDADELREIFRQQMAGCQKVFVLAHKKLKASSSVGIELEIAVEMGKQIIAVKPYGQSNIPSFVKRCAHKTIPNNIVHIVKALEE